MEVMLSSAEHRILAAPHLPGWKLTFPRRSMRAIAPFWVTCLIIGSFLPAPVKEKLGTTTRVPEVREVRQVALQHRLVHLASFGSTALLFLVIAGTVREERKGAAFVLLLGCAIEILQSFPHHTVFEWWDVRDDSYAVATVFIAVQVLNRFSEKRALGRFL